MPKIIIIFILLILILAGAFFIYNKNYSYCAKYTCRVGVTLTEEEINQKKDFIKEAEQAIKNNPENLDNYLSLGLYYKSIGELAKAKSAYLDGVKINDKFYLYYLNLGNISVDMKDYASAKEFYLKAIENKTLEPSSYIKLADLLFYQIKAPDKEIREVYLAGLKNTRNDLNICKSYASYLAKIKEYSVAADMWRTCLLKDPDNEAIKNMIEELRSKS